MFDDTYAHLIESTAFDENVKANGRPGDWMGVNPFEASYRDDPYPAINTLREKEPVNLTPVNTWRISRFEDITKILRSGKTCQTLASGVSPGFDPLDQRGSFNEFMLNKDGHRHEILRNMVVRSLNVRMVKKMEGFVEETVKESIDTALRQGGMEVISDLACLVPSKMICRILGIPEEERLTFDSLTASRTNGFFARFLPEDVKERTRQAGNEMADYFEAMIRDRRRNAQDDLITELIHHADEQNEISDIDVVIQAIGLITAGYETTIGLIGNGVRALVEHPEQMALLQESPDLINSTVAECLRYDTPIHFIWRVLTEPMDVGGKVLPKDAVIWLYMAAANRDPRKYDEPDLFDIHRANPSTVSFGGGPHYCLGNQLARMEAKHAIGEFAKRTKGMKIEATNLEWSHSFFRVMGTYKLSII